LSGTPAGAGGAAAHPNTPPGCRGPSVVHRKAFWATCASSSNDEYTSGPVWLNNGSLQLANAVFVRQHLQQHFGVSLPLGRHLLLPLSLLPLFLDAVSQGASLVKRASVALLA